MAKGEGQSVTSYDYALSFPGKDGGPLGPSRGNPSLTVPSSIVGRLLACALRKSRLELGVRSLNVSVLLVSFVCVVALADCILMTWLRCWTVAMVASSNS